MVDQHLGRRQMTNTCQASGAFVARNPYIMNPAVQAP